MTIDLVIPMWSPWQREQVVNETLAVYDIPIFVSQHATDAKESWWVDTFGESMEAVLVQIRSIQLFIMETVEADGIYGIARADALFMYVSQWVEYTLAVGLGDAMEEWFIIYSTYDMFYPS